MPDLHVNEQPRCPVCRNPMIVVTNQPGTYLCPVCRVPRVGFDETIWGREVAELRAQQRQAATRTMVCWRTDADHLPS